MCVCVCAAQSMAGSKVVEISSDQKHMRTRFEPLKWSLQGVEPTTFSTLNAEVAEFVPGQPFKLAFPSLPSALGSPSLPPFTMPSPSLPTLQAAEPLESATRPPTESNLETPCAGGTGDTGGGADSKESTNVGSSETTDGPPAGPPTESTGGPPAACPAGPPTASADATHTGPDTCEQSPSPAVKAAPGTVSQQGLGVTDGPTSSRACQEETGSPARETSAAVTISSATVKVSSVAMDVNSGAVISDKQLPEDETSEEKQQEKASDSDDAQLSNAGWY